jgi:hypothetical protein
MYHLFKNSSTRIVFVSFFVYLFVNLFENIIHYDIGKFSDRGSSPISIGEAKDFMPNSRDWTKIIGVMIVFAGIQGLLTCYFSERCF